MRLVIVKGAPAGVQISPTFIVRPTRSFTGKTHLAIALGVEPTKQKRRVLFTRAADGGTR